MNAVIMPNLDKSMAAECTVRICRILSDCNIKPYIDASLRDCFDNIDVSFADIYTLCPDIVIAVGGDGTILRSSSYAISCNAPLLGVNTGRLGFMASVEYDGLDVLSRIAQGECSIENRMLLKVTHVHDGEENVIDALNDAVISRPYSKIADYRVTVNGSIVTQVRADGIVFSSPTGSTAYALSAGGPIIEPSLECIEYTTICPHSLFSRPMIFSPTDEICVSLTSKSDDVYCTVDGAARINILCGDTLIITRSDKTLKLVNMNPGSFFDAINKKMMRSLKGEAVPYDGIKE